MKIRKNIKDISKPLFIALAITLTAMQAEASCWTAGAFDGSCQQKTSPTIEKRTAYSSNCWTAGVLNGMCYEKPFSVAEPKKESSTKSCWTAGVLDGMCY